MKFKNSPKLFVSLCVAAVAAVAPGIAAADGDEDACSIAMTRASYGFQCHGYVFTGSNLEPVTFIGTLRGDGRGFFEGYGTLNSSQGSASTHVAGRGTLLPRCFGHVRYDVNNIIVPGVGEVPSPAGPIEFDYTAVDGGRELLGTGTPNFSGAAGDAVPRLTCRLVQTNHKKSRRDGDE